MGIVVSSSHVVSADPSSSGGGLLILFPCSRVRSLSQETVLHKLLQCESFPQAAALHKLPQHDSFPWEQSFRKGLLQCGSPTESQAPPKNLLLCGLLSPWIHRSCQEPAPAQVSPQDHSLLQASTCSGVGSLPRGAGGYLLHRGPPWTAE